MLKTTVSFRSLLRFNVLHEYYDQRFCRDFDFYPTTSTQMWLKKLDLVYKTDAFGFEIGYNMERQETIEYFLEHEDLLKLSFVLFPKNPLFFNFTNLPFADNATFYVSNLNPNAVAENDIRLHKNKFLGKEELFAVKESCFNFEASKENLSLEILDINSAVVFQKTLVKGTNQIDISALPAGKYSLKIDKKIVEEFVFANVRSASPPLVFMDFFWISPIKSKKKYDLYNKTITSRLYNLVFENRSTIWKYYVVPKYANGFASLQLETSNDIQFSKPVETQISDGSKAFLFVSQTPLELKEVTAYEFKLKKQQRADVSKVVIKRMPVANTRLIKPEKDGFFSEILVYV